MTDKMRDEFEAWAALHWLHCAHKPVKMLDGQYQNNELQASLESWQASRESLVIELPEKCEYADPQSEYAKGYRQGMRAVVDQVEAAGLKVKP